MFELVMIGLGSTAALAVTARLLDRLLDLDQLTALPDDGHAEEL